jgi:hypothetical protein
MILISMVELPFDREVPANQDQTKSQRPQDPGDVARVQPAHGDLQGSGLGALQVAVNERYRFPTPVSHPAADGPANPAPQVTMWGASGSAWCRPPIVLIPGFRRDVPLVAPFLCV